MARPSHPIAFPAVALALASATLLAGCEQRTTTVQTPEGTSSSTTVVPSASAAAVAARVGNAVADAALTTKVKAALLADHSASALQIDVDSRDGAVTLNGSADSASGVARAETVARGVEGVRSVDNKLGVGTSSTAAIVTVSPAASAALDSAGRALARAADSTGQAASRAADRMGPMAERARDALGDAAITAKVKAALLADADVKGMQIDVDTKDGAVTLNGSLERRAGIDRAGQIAERVDGVRSVANRLAVKAPG